MPIVNGLNCYEDAMDPKSPSFQAANDNGRATQTLQIREPSLFGPATNQTRYGARALLLGWGVVNWNTAGQTWINRSTPTSPPGSPTGQLPAAYPPAADGNLNPDDLPWEFCTNIARDAPIGAVQGVGIDGTGTYAGARIEAQYNTLAWQILPDSDVIAEFGPLMGFPDEGARLQLGWPLTRYIARYFKPGARIITVPNGFMKNVRTKGPVRQGLAVRQVFAELKYTWMQVPLGNVTARGYTSGVPQIAWGICLGGVNDAVFDGFAKGTLLLKNIEEKRYKSGLGQWLVDITYTMEYLPNVDLPQIAPPAGQNARGHNSYLAIDNGILSPYVGLIRYDYFTSNGLDPDTGTGNVTFPYVSFRSLFAPDQAVP